MTNSLINSTWRSSLFHLVFVHKSLQNIEYLCFNEKGWYHYSSYFINIFMDSVINCWEYIILWIYEGSFSLVFQHDYRIYSSFRWENHFINRENAEDERKGMFFDCSKWNWSVNVWSFQEKPIFDWLMMPKFLKNFIRKFIFQRNMSHQWSEEQQKAGCVRNFTPLWLCLVPNGWFNFFWRLQLIRSTINESNQYLSIGHLILCDSVLNISDS